MKFSFLTYQFCRFGLEHSFKMAQEYGFEGVEVWGGRPHAYAHDMGREEIQAILGWKKQYGVEISMFTPEILAYPYSLTSSMEKERRETIEYLLKSVETAARLGTGKMQITAKHPGYGVKRETVWGYLEEGASILCRRAGELGVDIILESLSPSEGNTITCVDDILQLQERVKSPALCAMIDMVPPFIANEPYSDYLERLGTSMKYVHICNGDGTTEFHMQLDDRDGVIPVADFFRILKRYGYDGWCSLELLNPYFRDPELYLSQAERTIRRIREELDL